MKLPDGWHSVTPRIVTEDVTGLVEFLRRTFDATGEVHPDRPAVLRIADSNLMISGAGPRPASPAFLYVYVEDVDTTYRRAVEAGARSLVGKPILLGDAGEGFLCHGTARRASRLAWC